MSWLTLLRYGGLALVGAFLTWAVIDRFRLADRVAQYRACDKAAATPGDPIDACSNTIVERVAAARRADDCEKAITAGDLYTLRASCTAGVKHQHAELGAAQARVANLDEQLRRALANTSAAVARAEARGVRLADRTAENARTIEAAPRRADGRVLCNPDCVRRIAGDAAGDRR
ncbi:MULTISPECIES: hypothetical protein [unclassified Sphingomonas]|uniref:hypothetical protein n=1 Tax=unclassified Sphingomonas TaxID=196159 RepID=UPI000833D4D2|nr:MULTISPECIES: hypothetical protein [unclassified Sphingomonas]